MKKIGKSNPKEAEMIADNQARKEWNQAVDVALVEGVPEAVIKEIKKKVRNVFTECFMCQADINESA